MCAFVVLGLVFHIKPRDWLWECLRNDSFCVDWDACVSPGAVDQLYIYAS